MASDAPTNGDAPSAPPALQTDAVERVPLAPQESRLPTRKDVSLREFLDKIDDYAPIVCYLSDLNGLIHGSC